MRNKLNPEVFRLAINKLYFPFYVPIGCCHAIMLSCIILDIGPISYLYRDLLYEVFCHSKQCYFWGDPAENNLTERIIALETLALICEGEIEYE